MTPLRQRMIDDTGILIVANQAVSFQESLRAQCPRKCIYTLVQECLPEAQGTSSTTTPHCLHWTRRMK